MKTQGHRTGFSLLECLVYISVLTVTLTLAYPAFYRAMKASRDLRRNADDIERALHAGERWRADVRLVKAAPRLEGGALIIPQAAGAVVYSFEAGAVWRNDGRSKVRVLRDVKASRMENAEGKPSAPGNVAIGERRSVWRWELELASRTRGTGPAVIHFSGGGRSSTMKNERGSATLVVLTLVVVLTALVMANAMVVHHLRSDLKRIDRQQQIKFASPRR